MNNNLNFKIDRDGVNRRQSPPVVRTSFITIIITVVIAALVLALDLSLPLGVAGAVPYVGLVLIGIRFPKPQHVYFLAALGTALTIIGYLASPSGGTDWVVLTNRGLSLFAIWIVALLISSRKKFENELLLARDNLEVEVFERTRELMKSETSFRAVTQSAQDAIISIDKDGLIVQWNNGAQHMFGYGEEEILGQSATVLMPVRYRKAHTSGINRLMAGGKRQLGGSNVEVEALGKNGNEFPIELALSDWRINDEIFVTSIIRDISQRRQSDEALLKLSQTVEQNPNMSFITNTEGVIEYANAKFYEITGYSSKEVLGQTPRIIQSGNTPQALYTVNGGVKRGHWAEQ